jgi:hypothetical protein
VAAGEGSWTGSSTLPHLHHPTSPRERQSKGHGLMDASRAGVSSVHPSPTTASWMRRLGLLVAIVGAWLVVGFLRAPGLAANAETVFESPQVVSNIRTTTFPALPPFMVVQVEATIGGPSGPAYASSQTYLIEPFTGWFVNLSHLGLAPSA